MVYVHALKETIRSIKLYRGLHLCALEKQSNKIRVKIIIEKLKIYYKQ